MTKSRYPDYSKPLSSGKSVYPDYSKPLSGSADNILSHIKNTTRQNNTISPTQRMLSDIGLDPNTRHDLATAGTTAASMIPGGGLIPALIRIAANTGISTTENTLNPENKKSTGQNALENAGINTAIESVPVVGKTIGKGLDYFQPQKYAEKILNQIGGLQSHAQNARILADKIKSKYQQAKDYGSDLYNDVFSGTDTVRPGRYNSSLRSPIESQYLNLPKEVTDSYLPDIKKLHNQYLDNPTLRNAHELQSQLGFEGRKLSKMDKKNQLGIADKSVMQHWNNARESLIQDMGGAFDAASHHINPDKFQTVDLKNSYAKANENWAQNVAPYLDNPKISNISKNESKKLTGSDVSNISKEFANAHEDSDMSKIVSDIGHTAHNHILYDRLGKLQGKVTPERLISEVAKLRNEGFENFISPKLEKELEQLATKSTLRSAARSAPGVLGGLAAGSHFGSMGEIIGAPALGFATNKLFSKFHGTIPGLPDSVKNAISQSYRPAAQASANALRNMPGSKDKKNSLRDKE